MGDISWRIERHDPEAGGTTMLLSREIGTSASVMMSAMAEAVIEAERLGIYHRDGCTITAAPKEDGGAEVYLTDIDAVRDIVFRAVRVPA